MVTQAPKRGAVFVAVAFVLSCVVLITYVWGQFGGTLPLRPKGYRIHASFLQASQLTRNADVRMAGVNVGKVVAVRRDGLRADATLELDRRYAPLSRDARAILRQKTLLGEAFVALTPGTRGAAKLREGGRLPTANVQSTQQLDTVLGSFDRPTQRNLRRFLDGFSDALDGRGADLNNALGNLAPTLDSLDRLTVILDHQRPALARLVRNSGAVLDTVGARRADLASLVSAGDDVFATTAARNRELVATVRALPPLLRTLRSTLRVTDSVAGDAAPTLRVLRPVAPLVRPTLEGLLQVAPEVTRLMHEFGPVITVTQRALPAVRSITLATRPFIHQVQDITAQTAPLDALAKSYAGVLTGALANLSATFEPVTTASDGTRIHYARTLIPTMAEGFVGATQRTSSLGHNAYPAPGVLEAVGNGILPSSDCRNAGNAPGVGETALPCHVQNPFAFGGTSSYYPRLEAARP